MAFLDRMERRFGWLAFPGFLRFYALFHVLVFGLQLVKPGLEGILAFDREKILAGEVWRLATFLFASSGGAGLHPLTIVFLFFAVQLLFLFSDGLEAAWGAFRTSVFCYLGILTIVAGSFVVGPLPGVDYFFYASAFFAFATLFPTVELRVMLLIPVQVRYLAILAAGLLVMGAVKAPILFPLLVLYFLNYLLFAGIPALRGGARVVHAANRRRNFRKKQAPEGEAFHRCEVCGRTDVSDPELEFRIGGDGRELCVEHLEGGNSRS